MSDLKVACATSTMAGYFASVFPGMIIINPKDKVMEDLDLLIMTGGEDVNPSRYSEKPTLAFGWNDKRDDAEFSIYNSYMRFSRANVLGVCRGMQLMNVAKGGTLYQDLSPSHSHNHPISSVVSESPFSYLKYVNSLHHQGLRSLGGDYAKVLAVEPISGIPEIISWRDRELAVQFHPELFAEEPKRVFFDIIKNWVLGIASLSVDSRKSRSIPLENFLFNPEAILIPEDE